MSEGIDISFMALREDKDNESYEDDLGITFTSRNEAAKYLKENIESIILDESIVTFSIIID